MQDELSGSQSQPTVDLEADRRARKTQSALQRAFHELVLERHYDQIRVSDIVQSADVGRSTFYEHYRDKDELLLSSMELFFSVLSQAPFLTRKLTPEAPELRPLSGLVAHFLDNRSMARYLLDGPPSSQILPQILRRLSQRIAQEVELKLPPGSVSLLPLSYLCQQVAEAQFSLLRACIRAHEAPDPKHIALALARSSGALLDAAFVSEYP